ncbi:MAG: MBL fold metallo-hydrolase [Bacteroidetes bacterium]|nr:MBL fold metallo-hydrolase [Bacteroidota bacterium]
MIFIKKIEGNEWIPNCYIVHDNSDAIIIDPGCDYKFIREQLGGYKLKAIIATHGHYDHIFNVANLQNDYCVPFYLHPGDKKLIKHANFYLKLFHGMGKIEIPAIDFLIGESELLDFEFIKMKVIHTPGHTEGSVCFLFENNLFSGDLLLKNTIGRTDLPGGDFEKLKKSIKKLSDAFDDINILPGHFESTTLGHMRQFNRKLIEIITL